MLKVSHLEYIDKSEAFYISRVKTTAGVYEKANKKYSIIDLTEYSRPLDEGKTIEIPEVYLGVKEKLKYRLIVTKLSKEKKLAALLKNAKEKAKNHLI